MSDPTGGGAIVTRIVLTREGAGEARAAREELAGLVQAQHELASSSGPAEAGTQALGAGVGRLGASGAEGGRGLHIVRTAMTQLAFEATGTAGPVGRVAEGLLLFSAGSRIVLGAAAGLGAVAGAWRLLTQDIRDATEVAADAEKHFQGAFGGGLGSQIERQRAVVRALQAQIVATERLTDPNRIRIRPDFSFAIHTSGGAQAALEQYTHALFQESAVLDRLIGQQETLNDKEAHADAERVQRSFVASLQEANQSFAEAVIRGDRLRGVITDQQMERSLERVRLQAKGFNDEMIRSVQLIEAVTRAQIGRDQSARVAQGLAGFGPALRLGFSQPPLGLRGPRPTAIPTDLAHVTDDELARRLEASGHGTGGLDAAALMSAVLGLAGGARGGAGGLVAALGGVAAALPATLGLGPLASVLSAASGLLGLVDSAPRRVVIDSYTRKALDQQKEQEASKRNILILDVVAQIGDPKRVVYDLARYAARGGRSGIVTTPAGGAVPSRGG